MTCASRRRRRLMSASKSIAAVGWLVRNARKSSRPNSNRRVGSTAIASAERGSPSSSASSPKTSPGPRWSSATSRPRSAEVSVNLTRPDSMMHRLMPGSPVRKMTSPRAYFRLRSMLASCSTSRAARLCNRGTFASSRVVTASVVDGAQRHIGEMVHTPLVEGAYLTACLDGEIHQHELVLRVNQQLNTARPAVLERARRRQAGAVGFLLAKPDIPAVPPAGLTEVLRGVRGFDARDLVPGHRVHRRAAQDAHVTVAAAIEKHLA